MRMMLNAMLHFLKRVFRFLLIVWPKKYISRLGFVNYHIYSVSGPRDRLVLNGDYSDIHFNNTIFNTSSGTITIEKDCFFSHDVMLITGKHNFNAMDSTIFKQEVLQGLDIHVDTGTWIAAGAMVLGGVRLGKHCVVMAGAVVTKDFPDYSVLGGIPAKLVYSLKSEVTINANT